MRELSLFTGAGGGLLGTHLLGWRPIGYVEFNDYCQRVIRQRILDGMLPNAPIFGDIRAFLSSGSAELYRGVTDIITGGFPCQPFSVAGKQLGADDPRNMWPATRDCVRTIRPRYCFFENVPGLLNSGYFGTIVSDLAESGYCVRWRILSAAEVGAPHKRDRLWIYAHAESERTRRLPVRSRGPQQTSTDIDGLREDVADTCSSRQCTPHRVQSSDDGRRNDTPQEQSRWPESGVTVADCQYVGDPTSQGLSDGGGAQMGEPGTQPQLKRPSWWATEPDICRVAHGIPSRVDRLKALGNAQVGAVAAAAWHLLHGGE